MFFDLKPTGTSPARLPAVAMEHFLVHLFPKCDLGHVAGPAIFTRIAQQIPVFREIVYIVVFDSDTVDDDHFFRRNSDV